MARAAKAAARVGATDAAETGTVDARALDHSPAGIRLPGILLGVGLGGFFDGILLHQLLQWHHMLTGTDTDNVGVPYYPADTVSGLQMNTVWDGLFHTFTWLSVLIGLGILYARVADARGSVWSSRVLWGWILFGWGLFNLVEGIIDHHILGIHHVRGDENQLWWDLGFLALGVLLMIGGRLLVRSGRVLSATPAMRGRMDGRSGRR